MKKASAVLLAAGLTAMAASVAEAQICAGFPTVDRQFSFAARAYFPDEGDIYGVELSYDISGPPAVFGGLDVVGGDGSDREENVIRGGLALEFPVSLGAGPRLSVCGVGEFLYTSIDEGSGVQIPLGIGVGANLSAGTRLSLSPYAIPQFIFSSSDSDDPAVADRTTTDFGIRAGALLGFDVFFVGGEVQHVFGGIGDPLFGIRAGFHL